MTIVTRKEAQALGLTRYFSGNPCKQGHLAERATANGSCLACCREKSPVRHAQWKASLTFEQLEAHKGAKAEYDRSYNVKNGERKRQQSKAWYEGNKEKAFEISKAWVANNRERRREIVRKYDDAHREEKRQQSRRRYASGGRERALAYYRSRQEELNEYHRRHRQVNGRNKKQARIYKNWYNNTPRGLVANRLRSRLQSVLKQKLSTTPTLVGCTWDHLVSHLEARFLPGMTWENRREWHIDHIRPLASFDLLDHEQQRAANHYTNLQPLWAEDNLRKGAS
jgi:hypothetical protein